MKLNKYFMLGLVGLAFTACSNDEDVSGGNEREEGNVRITLSLGKASTKSMSASAANLYNHIDPTNVEVAFYNAQGTYVAMPEKVPGAGAAGADYDNKAAITEAFTTLANGNGTTHSQSLLLKGIPASASQIYIVTNNPGAIATSSLKAAKESVVTLRSQSNATVDGSSVMFSGQNATMTGLGTLPQSPNTAATDTEDAVYNVTVQLIPVPSRVEIQNVRALEGTSTGDEWLGKAIDEFTVEGFYINRFYPQGQLDGTQGDEEDRIDNGSDVTKYTSTAYGSITYDGQPRNYEFMCDEPATGQMTYNAGTDTDNIIWQALTDNSNWWGYQVMAGVPPHIVVKLSVKYEGESYDEGDNGDTKFLTIIGYTDTEKDEELTAVKRGTVYRIANLDFHVDDLTDLPYEGTKTISATVNVLAWDPVPVAPEFN